MKSIKINITGSQRILLMMAMAMIFFMWGLLTNLNFYLYRHLSEKFHLSYSISTLIDITFFFAYLVVSLQAGNLISKVGYKKGIIVGWILALIGCTVFFVAIKSGYYNLFLVALFIVATGITVLQVGANLYVVLLGEQESAPSRLVFTQAFNSLGNVMSPMLAGAVIYNFISVPKQELLVVASDLERIQMEVPYISNIYSVLAIAMSILTLVLIFIFMPEIDTHLLEPLNKVKSQRKRHVMHFSQLRLGAFAIFAYVGAEVALSVYLYEYEPRYAEYYWMLMLVGRFVGAGLLRFIRVNEALGFVALISCLLVLIAIVLPDSMHQLNFTLVMCVGLFNSIMFPSIFTMGVNGLGRYSIDGSAVLIMFIVGGAVIPFNVRNFSHVNYDIALLIVVACYLYISLYGFRFSKYEKREDLADDQVLI
ncbi:MAG: MFS transporter [Cytophagaceae bacterium]|jgi:FHS family L-fucose permease-like MFS transporter|nr:MFS transporter [Cytophagaceae bacterium]